MLRKNIVCLASLLPLISSIVAVSIVAVADEPTGNEKTAPQNHAPIAVEDLVEKVRNSIVQVSFAGRNGKTLGKGTGFIISADGLIATNMHVLGEARPIKVETADERAFEVQSVHASDRRLDMAIIKVDAADLPVLPLGDSDKVRQGQPFVIVGNPQGLKHSVVSGVISSRREIDGRRMLQLAAPIEPGNSGSPVLDAEGRVIGIVTMKSLVTDNLGFAGEINQLRPLIDKPNPISMSRWLTIGALDPREWTPMFGGKWQRRAGRIVASGTGDDPVGRRTLCISQTDLPELPFEMAVQVRLDDEAGAAGLVFHSDGGDKHYGFYPSNGNLRLSRFEGPTVFQWQVLNNLKSAHYRPGQWNHLKVRFEKEKTLCYVNDQLVVESNDRVLPTGKVGLAKFRQTVAEFKGFRVAKQIPPSTIPAETQQQLERIVDALPGIATLTDKQAEPLAETPAFGTQILRQRAAELQQRAKELQRIADDIHVKGVARELGKLMQLGEKADLMRAALLIARLDNEELDIEPYLRQIDRMADEVREAVGKEAGETKIRDALNKYLFVDNGFHGGRTNYYHQANSYMNQVLDDREGLPITLSVLYMELGRRLGLKIVGVGLPGHFVVKHVQADGDGQLIDAFEGGRLMEREQAERFIREAYRRVLEEDDLRAATKKEIVMRMLLNLRKIAKLKQDEDTVLRYLEAAVAIEPEGFQERLMRAEMRFLTGRRDAAVADLDWIIEREPEGIDIEGLRQAREYFRTNSPPVRRGEQ